MADLPRRRKIRNQYHDYSLPGSYFITIDVRFGQCLFGQGKSENEIELNSLGKVAESSWLAIPIHFPHIMLGKFVVMPNHIHGIIHVGSADIIDDHTQSANLELPFISANSKYINTNQFGPMKKGSLGVIIGQYKASVARWANSNRYGGLFDWHSLFYDRIIKDKDMLKIFEKYIEQNPAKWWTNYGNKRW